MTRPTTRRATLKSCYVPSLQFAVSRLIVGALLAAMGGVSEFGTDHLEAAPNLANGSFESSITGRGVVPPGWDTVSGTPDVVDDDGPFNNTGLPWTLSPNGGTFVRGIGADSSNGQEAIEQMVSGFEIGETYRLAIYQSNLGFSVNGGEWRDQSGRWTLLVDGTTFDESNPVMAPIDSTTPVTWSADSLLFVANDTTQTIQLKATTTQPGTLAYLAIDGVQLSLVPEPSTMCLSAIGLLLLVAYFCASRMYR